MCKKDGFGIFELLIVVIIIGVIYVFGFSSMSDPGYNRLKSVPVMIDGKNPLIRNDNTNNYLETSVITYENVYRDKFNYPAINFTWLSGGKSHNVSILTDKVELLTDPSTTTPTVEFTFNYRFYRMSPDEFNLHFLKTEKIVRSDGLIKATIRMNGNDMAKER